MHYRIDFWSKGIQFFIINASLRIGLDSLNNRQFIQCIELFDLQHWKHSRILDSVYHERCFHKTKLKASIFMKVSDNKQIPLLPGIFK